MTVAAGQAGDEDHLPGRAGEPRFLHQRLEGAEFVAPLVDAGQRLQGAALTPFEARALGRVRVGGKLGAGKDEQQLLWLGLGGGGLQQLLEGGGIGHVPSSPGGMRAGLR